LTPLPSQFIMQACILIAIAFLIATNLYFYYTRTIGARGMDPSRREEADAALRAVEVESEHPSCPPMPHLPPSEERKDCDT